MPQREGSSTTEHLGIKVAALVGLALAALATPGFAEAPPPVAVRSSAAVNVARVDAFVTGTDGAPVRGLQAADFELFEDGGPVAITDFSPAQDAAAGVPSLLVFFVDGLDMTPSQCGAVFAGAQAMLAEVLKTPGTQAMVASGGLTVVVRQRPTSDAQPLLKALRAAQGAVGEGARTASGGTVPGTALDQPLGRRTDLAAADGEAVEKTTRGAAHQQYERARAGVENLTTFVAALGEIPGRKALIYVGGPIPIRPGEALLRRALGDAGPGAASPEDARFDISALVRALADKANATGVTIYGVDAGGAGRVGAPPAMPRHGEGQPAVGTGADLSAQDALQFLASTTGGRAFTNPIDPASAFESLVRDFRSSYSLGFAAPRRADGSTHAIRVKLKREGMAVRSRSAFLDATEDDRMSDRTLAALLFGIAENPFGLQASAKAEGSSKDGKHIIAVTVTIPLGKLAFAPSTVAQESDIALWLAARGATGRVVQSAKTPFPVSVPNDRLLTALTQSAGFTFRVPLDEGSGKFAVTARDEIGLQASTVVTALDAPATPALGVPN
ncbi:MAG: VWA domain-containing protein [Thermoanaerobaculaceae bacterium]|nr:VWA domain-containing protein [Thermoanaerobaculaceae bacterium]